MQEPDEPLQEYVRCFDLIRCGIRGIPDAAIIATFFANVRDARFVEQLATRPVRTVTELYRLADRWAPLGEEPRLNCAPKACRGRGPRRTTSCLVQGPDESLQEYARHFSQERCCILDLPTTAVVMTFYANVRDTSMRRELWSHQVHTVAELF